MAANPRETPAADELACQKKIFQIKLYVARAGTFRFSRRLTLSPSLLFGTSCLPEFEESSPVKDNRVHWKKRQKQIERLKAKHGADRSLIREFPDLKVEQRTAPCSNVMRGSTARRPRPAGMKQFPVGHSHKQGLELITPGTDCNGWEAKRPKWAVGASFASYRVRL
jgi:hypothetical protein